MTRVIVDRLIDCALIWRASVDFFRVSQRLHHSGFRTLMESLNEMETCDATSLRPRDIRKARRFSRRIAIASRVSFPHVKCLHRSLVLHKWLRSEGLPSELRIGVRKHGDELRAHAWVELAGIAVNDEPQALVPFSILRPLEHLDVAGTGSIASIDLRNVQWQ